MLSEEDEICQYLNQHGITFTGERLGQGTFARVEKVLDGGTPRAARISLKSKEDSKDIRHEIERGPELWRLTQNHPGLVTFIRHLLVPVAGKTFLVTIWELAEQKSLGEQIGKLSARECVKLLIPIADAIDYLRSQANVHRDVKPHNILLFADGRSALGDLGCARQIDPTDPRASIVGTFEFANPEQIEGVLHDSCDLYCLAGTYVQVVTGALIFDLKPGTSWQEIIRIKKDDQRTRARLADLPLQEQEVDVLMEALTGEATKRPNSAKAWIGRLKQAIAASHLPDTVAPSVSEAAHEAADETNNHRELVTRSIGIHVDDLPVKFSNALGAVALFHKKQLAWELRQTIDVLRDRVTQLNSALARCDTTDNDLKLAIFYLPVISSVVDLLKRRLDECSGVVWPEYVTTVAEIHRELDLFVVGFGSVLRGYLPRTHASPQAFSAGPSLDTFDKKIACLIGETRKLEPVLIQWRKRCDDFYHDFCRLLRD